MAPSDRRIASLRSPDAAAQSAITGPLLLDLLEWIAAEPRRYAETMEAWRTSCPRLPVWEEAVERGFVCRERAPELGATVAITEAGRQFLRKQRP
jgi:hypothetical protein